MSDKTLGQIAHDAGATHGKWCRRWSDMSERQKGEWEAIAAAVVDAATISAMEQRDELLKALRNLVRAESQIYVQSWDMAMEQARDAIAKAEAGK